MDCASSFAAFAAGLDLPVWGDDVDIVVGCAADHQLMFARHGNLHCLSRFRQRTFHVCHGCHLLFFLYQLQYNTITEPDVAPFQALHKEAFMLNTTEMRVSSGKRTQLLSITRQIVELVTRNGWQDGILTLFVPHTTAAVTINENADPDVARDMEWFSDELIPRSRHFHHSEGNSDAHVKASFFGSSLQVIVREGKLWLGTWQGIYFCEFDGPRERKVFIAFTC
jgi:secondary thiamine-phosphate synthase enzyme